MLAVATPTTGLAMSVFYDTSMFMSAGVLALRVMHTVLIDYIAHIGNWHEDKRTRI